MMKECNVKRQEGKGDGKIRLHEREKNYSIFQDLFLCYVYTDKQTTN